jgi:hypothetical protein
MIKYRIVEKIYSNGKSNFFPEFNTSNNDYGMCWSSGSNWNSCSNLFRKILNIGYSTYDLALNQTNKHKSKKNIVISEKIHDICKPESDKIIEKLSDLCSDIKQLINTSYSHNDKDYSDLVDIRTNIKTYIKNHKS